MDALGGLPRIASPAGAFVPPSTYMQAAISDRSPGDLLRAVGALGGERIWQGVRARVIGPPLAPPWLAELTPPPSETSFSR